MGPLLYVSSTLPTSSFINPHPFSHCHRITYTAFSFSNIPFPRLHLDYFLSSFKSRSSVTSSGESPWSLLRTFLKLEKLLRLFGVCVLAQLCPALCSSMHCSPPDFLSTEFSRQEYWRLHFILWNSFVIEGCSLGSSNHALSHRPKRQISILSLHRSDLAKACFSSFSAKPLPWALYFL